MDTCASYALLLQRYCICDTELLCVASNTFCMVEPSVRIYTLVMYQGGLFAVYLTMANRSHTMIGYHDAHCGHCQILSMLSGAGQSINCSSQQHMICDSSCIMGRLSDLISH